MVVTNLTDGRIRCTHETARVSFALMPRGHEHSALVLDEEIWIASERLQRLERKKLVAVDRVAAKKPTLAYAPDLDGFTRAQRASINALVLGSDIEYQAQIDAIPLDNQRGMPERVNYKYVRDKMIPAFEVAADWLHEIGDSQAKKRETALRHRIKDLTKMVVDNTLR